MMEDCDLSKEKGELLKLWKEVAKRYSGGDELHFDFGGFKDRIEKMSENFEKLKHAKNSEEIRKIINKIVNEIYARGKTETTQLFQKYDPNKIRKLFLKIYESGTFNYNWINIFTLKGRKNGKPFGELYGIMHINEHPIRNNAAITGLKFFGVKIDYDADYNTFEYEFNEFKENCYKKIVGHATKNTDHEVPINYEIDQLLNIIDKLGYLHKNMRENLVKTLETYEQYKNDSTIKKFYWLLLKSTDNKNKPLNDYKQIKIPTKIGGVQIDRYPQYWIMALGEKGEYWEECKEHGVVGIGDKEFDDFRRYKDRTEFEKEFKEIYKMVFKNYLENHNIDPERSASRTFNYTWKFYREMQIGDIVAVRRGLNKIVGIGVITSDYYFDPTKLPETYICHLRDVKWVFISETGDEIPQMTNRDPVFKLKNDESIDIIENLIEKLELNKEIENVYKYIKSNLNLNNLILIKNQIILYGPPGTGKTFQARQIATNFIKGSTYTQNFEEDYKKLEEDGRIEFITFHPTYSYEEFVEGYRPAEDGKFMLEDGIFKEICIKAAHALCESAGIDYKPDDKNNGKIFEVLSENKDTVQDAIKNSSVEKYVLIIDEINRGNISKIFGELITLLEPDKRIGGRHQTLVTLPYSKEKFGVPPNLYIIGTMNTADRSIALVDIALRRRFGFVEIPPEDDRFYEILKEASKASKNEITEEEAKEGLNRLDISELLKAMNERITFLADREKQIGHAYFLNVFRDENGDYVKDEELWKENLHRIWYTEIIPLLQEYFFNDYEKIKNVLGEDEKDNRFIEKIKKDDTVKDYVSGDVEIYDINRENKKLYAENFGEFVKALNKIYEPTSTDKTGE